MTDPVLWPFWAVLAFCTVLGMLALFWRPGGDLPYDEPTLDVQNHVDDVLDPMQEYERLILERQRLIDLGVDPRILVEPVHPYQSRIDDVRAGYFG